MGFGTQILTENMWWFKKNLLITYISTILTILVILDTLTHIDHLYDFFIRKSEFVSFMASIGQNYPKKNLHGEGL